jgi:Flp pilus assembly protein TadG
MRKLVRRFAQDRRGNIAPLVALLIVPLIGAMGLAAETSNWFMIQRGMQNAADSAALAAATNADPTVNASYRAEAKSVATNYGFTDGASNTTVAVINTDNTVPAVCNSHCYRVTITKTVPLYITQIVGYSGTTALGSGRGQTITAFAVASPRVQPTSYCLLSLGTGDSFHINGGNSVDLNGCYVRANGNTTCNGANSSGGATDIIYSGSNKKCDPSDYTSTPMTDPYLAQASKIPANTCSPPNQKATYFQESSGTLPASNLLTGNVTLPATQIYCGDVKLTGNVNLTTASPGSLMVIENGKLDMNGYTLKTLAGSGLSIIFTGPSIPGFNPSHIPTNGGILDFAAPTSGNWSGFSLYQDPALTSGVDMTAAGNSPTWNITGLIYLPNSNIQFSGIVNKADNGYSCFALVDYTFQSNGTGKILEDQSQCAQAGVTLPMDGTPVREALVQ